MPLSKTKTRGKGAAKPVPATASSTAPKVSLAPQSSNPPKVFILPKHTSSDARIVTLAHPKNSTPTRYLCCPEKGFFEFTKVGAPRTTPRSWLLAPSNSSTAQEKSRNAKAEAGKDVKDGLSKGYITKAADIFIATQLDPLFLVLPALAPPPSTRTTEPKKRMFLAGDDYLDSLTADSPHLRILLRKDSSRQLLETRMAAVCDTVDAGEIMYRLSEDKLLSELLRKAQRMVDGGLPASMEEKLVRKALEVPMLSLKRGESSMHELAEEESSVSASGDATPSTATESFDSQITVSSNSTIVTSASFASTAATSTSEGEESLSKIVSQAALTPIAAPEGIAALLRLRTAFNFLTSTYLPSHLSATLTIALSATSSLHSFSALDAHLTHLSSLRQAALAARSLGDFSRKRSLNEDEEAGEGRAEKKRKQEEEEKRKRAGESRGVRDLKKVNVQGMKKMSDFFKKK